MWIRSVGDDSATLHIAVGHFSEDVDGDDRLDSEDLPPNLTDTNGDNVVDLEDLDLENLSDEDKFRGNGKLELDEDEGWVWNGPLSDTRIGANNTILDTERPERRQLAQQAQFLFHNRYTAERDTGRLDQKRERGDRLEVSLHSAERSGAGRAAELGLCETGAHSA